MEAWDDEPRVRPIPVGDDTSPDSGGFAGNGSSGGSGDGPKHRWLPLVLAAAAAVIVVGSVATFGAVQDQDPPPADAAFVDSTTDPDAFTTTAPPLASLQETVTGITSRLTLIANGPDGPTALLWDPSFIQPKPLPIDVDPGREDETIRLTSATFDAGGSFVAVTTPVLGSDFESVRIGTPTDVSQTVLFVTTSHRWHASEVAHIAWIEILNGTATLKAARVNPLSKTLMDEFTVSEVPETATLLQWDTGGFVLNTGTDEVVALSQRGDEEWRIDAVGLAASASLILVVEPGTDPSRVAQVTTLDRSGTTVEELFSVPITNDIRSRFIHMSANTDLAARIDIRDSRTRIEVFGAELAANRVLQYNDDIDPIGFTSNDQYFVFGADGSNDLIFVNWNIGRIQELNVPDQYEVVGFDLG